MKKSRDYLNYLLTQAEAEANETYEQVLENLFDHYFEQECDEDDDINEARADFKQSSYYFLKYEDFQKQKNENLNSLKNEAQKIIVDAIDTLIHEDLKNLKEIYNQILEIIDSNQVDFHNDCKLIY